MARLSARMPRIEPRSAGFSGRQLHSEAMSSRGGPCLGRVASAFTAAARSGGSSGRSASNSGRSASNSGRSAVSSGRSALQLRSIGSQLRSIALGPRSIRVRLSPIGLQPLRIDRELRLRPQFVVAVRPGRVQGEQRSELDVSSLRVAKPSASREDALHHARWLHTRQSLVEPLKRKHEPLVVDTK